MIVTIGGIPVYDAVISDEETGMFKISLVDDPAVMSNFQAFDAQRKPMLYAIQDEEKRLVRGCIMRADFPIYRPFLKKETTNKKGETHVYTEEELLNNYMKTYRTFEMSDHLPLWVEFKVDFSGQYLSDLESDLNK